MLFHKVAIVVVIVMAFEGWQPQHLFWVRPDFHNDSSSVEAISSGEVWWPPRLRWTMVTPPPNSKGVRDKCLICFTDLFLKYVLVYENIRKYDIIQFCMHNGACEMSKKNILHQYIILREKEFTYTYSVRTHYQVCLLFVWSFESRGDGRH